MKSANTAIRMVFAAAAFSPLLISVACDLHKADDSADAAVVATAVAPTATDTAAATAAASVAPIVPATPQTLAGAKNTGKTVKLADGGTGAVVTLRDGGSAIVASSSDGGIPGFPGFTLPTALPSGLTMPSSLPTALPSNIPTTLPSGFRLPTFPTASAGH